MDLILNSKRQNWEKKISSQHGLGLGPLLEVIKVKDPSKERRDHVVWNDKNLITVSGGKLTTFRLIAIDVLNQAKNLLPEPKEIVEETVFHTPKNTGTHLDYLITSNQKGYWADLVIKQPR